MKTAASAVTQVGRARSSAGARALLAAATAATCLVIAPVAAQAATAPAPALSASAVCGGVSPSQIAGVLGFSVPKAVGTTNNDYFDKALDIHENSVLCDYGTPTSLAAMQHDVVLLYETLSSAPPKAVAISEIKTQLAKAAKDMPKGSSFTYSFTSVGGVTSLWSKVTAKEGPISFTFEYAVGWQGTKVAGGWVSTGLAQSKVENLEKLALNNFGM